MNDERELFARCNRTELLQLAQGAGLHLHPLTPREKIIDIFLGIVEPPAPYLEMASWRHGLMKLILDNWDNVRSQLNCPAKSKDPRSCFGCTDMQVVTCLSENREHLYLISERKRYAP